MNINLIDFGYMTSFIDSETKCHIQKSKKDTFKGNIIFSSLSQLKFATTSRRDDLRSLFYLLVYCFKRGDVPLIDMCNSLKTVKNRVDFAMKFRQSETSKDLCRGNTEKLYKLKKEIFKYKFMDEPNYA